MSARNFLLSEFRWNARYRLTTAEDILTPALVLYPDVIASNIAQTLQLLNGNADRWRAHVKTAKLDFTLRRLLEGGVHAFKCATTLELARACRAGAPDVLLAYPVMGANARRAREIADEFPDTRISVLVENEQQLQQWSGTRVGIFLDINPGMNRTGIEQGNRDAVIRLARAVVASGLHFRGLHYYDGQYGGLEQGERTVAAHAGYDLLLELVRELDCCGAKVVEVITAGTPTFPGSLTYAAFQRAEFTHRISPGTIVYCDATSLAQLPAEFGYAPAALVLTRVVSHPSDGIITCDAGHKAVSADAGVPTCVVVGHPELTPLSPSEEHLPMRVADGANPPEMGELLYLVPRHVCATVNNFDKAVLVRDGKIVSVEDVSARGHESPLLRGSELIDDLEPAQKH